MQQLDQIPANRALRYWHSRVQKSLWILREEGVFAILMAVLRKPANYWHEYRRIRAGKLLDEMLGLDTGFRHAEEAQFPAMMPETQQGYDPMCPDSFRRMLGCLAISFEEFSFVDLGSGKGRALIMASDYPFQRIIGVEYSPHYHQVACQNIESLSRRTGESLPFELISGDATEFEIPTGKCVVFLFNPFQGTTFSRVIRNLETALTDGTDEIYVIYNNPVCRQEMDTSPAFQVFHDRPHHDPYRAFVIYQGRAGSPAR